MTTDPQLIIGFGGGLATLFVIVMTNRRRISIIENVLWGHNDDSGIEDTHDSLESKIDNLEEIMSDMRRERQQDHEAVLDEVYINRLYQHDTAESIAKILNEEDDLADVDIEPEDIKPDWIDTDKEKLHRRRMGDGAGEDYNDDTR